MKKRPRYRKHTDLGHLWDDEYEREAGFRGRSARVVKAGGTPVGSRGSKAADYHVRRRYGLDEGEYDQRVQEQEGKCAVCKKPAALVVDHCHDGGHVRGLLCRKCNVMLGMAEDSAAVLIAAVAYLKK